MSQNSLVRILPQSLENARWIGDLQLSYKNKVFSGDALVALRGSLVEIAWDAVKNLTPFCDQDVRQRMNDTATRAKKQIVISGSFNENRGVPTTHISTARDAETLSQSAFGGASTVYTRADVKDVLQ